MVSFSIGKENTEDRIAKKKQELQRLQRENELMEEERKLEAELEKERKKRYSFGVSTR